jgi:hypothetical protein
MGLGLLVHTLVDMRSLPGSLNVSPLVGAMSLGSGIGLLISIALLRFGILPLSFAEGAPDKPDK